MTGKCLLFTILLLFSETCFAQQLYQLSKQVKKEIKKLQKEGWQTIDPDENLVEQYSNWHKKELELCADGSSKYLIENSEIEDASIQIAERRAWDEACAAIRRREAMKITSSLKTEESSSSYGNGSGETHSEVFLSQKSKTNYTGTMNDIVKVLAIYKKVSKGYIIRIIVAKEINK